MKLLSHLVLRYAGIIALVGTLLAAVGAYFSVELYKNLRTDLEELLPNTARAVRDLGEIQDRLESIDNLAVLVFSQNTEASKRFVTDLAGELNNTPKNVISSVEYKISHELQFFRDRQALYMDLSDLEKVRDYIRDRIDYEKDLYNPLNIFRSEELPEPKLDFEALESKYASRTSSYDRFPDGYYATPDGKKRVVLVYLPGKTSSISQVHALKQAVADAIAKLDPKKYASDLKIEYTGGVQDTIEEQSALIADLELSTVIVVVLVTLAMIIFYRNLRATLALVFSIFSGTLWTFGIAYFVVGYLNANSAFLGSIVIGNGINFGIIYLARYLEERRNGRSNIRATRLAVTHTATATWTAALAAGLAYGSLILTGFRGFRQFGIIGLIGMVLCWISAFTLLPAYLSVFDRWKPLVKKGGAPQPRAWIANGVAYLVSHWPKVVCTAAVAATIASIVSIVSALADGRRQILETDLRNLRNKESVQHGSMHYSKYLDEIFQRYLSPLVILPKDRESARKIAAILKNERTQEGPATLLASVQTLDDFLPDEQREKLDVLQDIRKLLPPRLLARLSHDDQERVSGLLRAERLKPVDEEQLPALLLKKFTEKDGAIGNLVLVEPPLDNRVTGDGRTITHLIHELRSAADSVAPGTAVAGALPIISDMFEAISRDGPRATAFALMAVVTLVVFLFRDLATIAQVLLSLGLGVIWLAGIILGFRLKINFLNFIALPITFGIGVDYGVNIFQRYREEGGKGIEKVIQGSGGAVMLCSFTTITGYTSLLIAGNQGFVSFGTLAVTGELTCVTAAVVALPAFLVLLGRRRSPKQHLLRASI